MTSRMEKVIHEDTSLSRSSPTLWNIQRVKPEIRQIYGSYLPPLHLKTSEGLVAKDFAFPADAVIPKIVSSSIDKKLVNQLYALGERILPESLVSISDSVKIRAEGRGAVVYTSYFSGFFLNEAAYSIVKLCNSKLKVGQIAKELGYDINIVTNFLVRCLALGIINVCT